MLTPTQKLQKQPWGSQNLNRHARYPFISSIHSWDTASFKVLWPEWRHPFWLTLWFCVKMPKMRLFTNLCWSYKWLKNPAIWLAESILAHISGARFFPNMGLCRNIANNINFHYRTNSEKTNAQIFQIQKTLSLQLLSFWE